MELHNDDDYIANLLSQEAKTTNRSLSGLLHTRPAGAAPKPNTRFLRNIVRDADFHNAALLAKDAAETQSRLRRLDREDQRRLSRSPSPDSVKKEPGHPDHEERTRHWHRRRSRRSRSRSPNMRGSRRHERHRRRSRSRSSERERSSRKRYKGRERDVQEGRSFSRSRDSGRPRDSGRRRKHKRARSRVRDEEGPEHTEKQSEGTHDGQREKNRPPESPHSTFSDPLHDLIGPSPAKPVTRGRGAKGQAAMDSHFLSSYDPAMEAQHSHDNFDDAVEAYRDRQKWKQQGAERLRNAGLGEDFIRAWENNDIKNEANLKWTKKGSIREWDRGKILEDHVDGAETVDLRVNWVKK